MKHDGIRSRKIKAVVEYLQNALFPLAEGDRLPGFRTVMRDTGAGRRTVAHALAFLVKEGVIRVDPQRGVFRIKPAEKTDEIRLLHWRIGSLDADSFVGILFRALTERAAADGRRITVENVGSRSQEDIADELIRHGISNCIVYGAKISDFAEFLNAGMKVCMELLPRHTADNVIALRESPDMTVVQFDYLRNLGYSRIGYIHFCGKDVSLYPVQVMRLLDYYRLMAENHLPVDPGWVYHCKERYGDLEEGLLKIMSTVPAPQVLIVPGSSLKYLYPLCRKHKIRIGRDLAVFSCDDPHENFTPEVTMVTNDPEAIAENCWRMFSALSRGEKISGRSTELHIRIGRTVPSLKRPGRSETPVAE
ncbi:MAG: substrate-binding domain-containing protein [Lentisphaeria bacterium]|nr:substrate-binding domain-containing protein [Lentisphaeria bacterium]